MTNQPATGKQNAGTTPLETASATKAGVKCINDAIAVLNEPSKTENEDNDASCLASSGITCRTPPKPRTRPGKPPGAPTKPKHRQMSPFDLTESDDEEAMEQTKADAAKEGTSKQSEGSIGHIIDVLRKAKEKLSKLRTTGPNLDIKADVIKDLDETIQEAIIMQDDHINNIKNDLKEIKMVLNDVIKVQSNAATKPKTWAQVTAQGTNAPMTKTQEIDLGKTERLDRFRREREKVEFMLSMRNASEDTKKQLANMNETEFIKIIQNASGCHLRGVRKMANHTYKIRCLAEKDAQILRNVNWNDAINGAIIIKRTYGIVMHGVPKYDVDFEKDNLEELKTQIENANNGCIKINKIAPLRRRARNPNATTQSIVIFTDHPEEADECIENGIIIEHRLHKAERYLRQGQIKQCFNCQGYGHEASVCKKKPRCGKCAKDHPTNGCTNEQLQCVHCSGEHAAWHRECPRRQRESAQKEAIKDAMSPLYTRSC